MSGMADVIAAHQSIWECMGFEDDRTWLECSCRSFSDDDWTGDLDAAHAAHVAVELTKAGFGNVQEALLSAADEMPIETLLGADKASVWVRERAHTLDPKRVP